MADYVLVVEGIKSLEEIENLDSKVLLNAQRAVNRVTEETRADSARAMREQVAFPARYLSGQNGRLRVTKKATAADLEAKITGRFRPTSLARFAKGSKKATKQSRGYVRVEVKPGHVETMRGAFLMKLRSGADELGNIGLAIRLPKGETLRNKKNVVKVSSGLYILYSPSVDQVFRSVKDDQIPLVRERLEREFKRLMETL